MRARTLWKLVHGGRLRLLRGLGRHAHPLYRAGFLAAAGSSGLLQRLAEGPVPLGQLADALGIGPAAWPALQEWLEIGVRTGLLSRDETGYTLRGRFARALARPGNDDLLAMLTEIVELHHRLVVETPSRLRGERPFTLADQDGALIARSSRLMEPLVHEAVAEVIPRQGSVRLLEVGCGSGAHIRFAAERNPRLRALGIELQPEVARLAEENLAAWGLADRVRVDRGDVRNRIAEPEFDVVTLHNNIYYFPVEERPDVLAQLRGFLRPGGRLLCTTACRGRSAEMAALSLWGAATEGCGRLPRPGELVEQLQSAGYQGITARNLLAPFDEFYAFMGGV